MATRQYDDLQWMWNERFFDCNYLLAHDTVECKKAFIFIFKWHDKITHDFYVSRSLSPSSEEALFMDMRKNNFHLWQYVNIIFFSSFYSEFNKVFESFVWIWFNNWISL